MKYLKFRSLLTCIFAWLIVFCAGVPAPAAEQAPLTFRLPLTQRIDTSAGINAEEILIPYRLTPVDAAPLPEDAAGDSFLFSIRGNEAASILFRFPKEGYYSYLLEMSAPEGSYAENLTAVQDAYRLVISAFSPEVSASLYGTGGEKYADLSYHISEPQTPSSEESSSAPPATSASSPEESSSTPPATTASSPEESSSAPPATSSSSPEESSSAPPATTTSTPEESSSTSPATSASADPSSASSSKSSPLSAPKTGDAGMLRWVFLLLAAGAGTLLLVRRMVCQREHERRS